MATLQQLDGCRPRAQPRLPPGCGCVITPLRWRQWAQALAQHPDRQFVSYVVEGIRSGFRVGFNYAQVQYSPAKQNMPSAEEHANIVADYLKAEVTQGRVCGPFVPASWPQVQISRFGVIPKSTPGKWRLILDLSSPKGRSVNDGIDGAHCSLSYVSVDDAAQLVRKQGKGALMAKVDIQSAYRTIPVHPDDRVLLGMVWNDQLFIDTALPFGLHSAPKIFTAVADAAAWAVKREIQASLIHYLDDFLIVAPSQTRGCQEALHTLLQIFEGLGIPVAVDKLEGPSPVITFLGIVLDSEKMTCKLPEKKLNELHALVENWLGRRSCTKRELQSVAGKLQHACKVVTPGRTFLWRIFELLRVATKPHHHIRLTGAVKADLYWWHTFLTDWNGVSLLYRETRAAPDHHVFTDASGHYGCGAVWNEQWLVYAWDQEFVEESIAPKELLPIVMACAIWGREWQQLVVCIHCDNMAVVDVVNSGYSKHPQVQHLLRCLFFITATFGIMIHAVHILGVDNEGADAISRNNMHKFFRLHPQASPSPTPLPQDLVDLLIKIQPEWTSPTWRKLFKGSLQLVWRNPQGRLTSLGATATCPSVLDTIGQPSQ